jgi:hypothetical protein
VWVLHLLRIKLASSFILFSDCDSFFIMMTEPRKRKVFSIQEKMDIPAQVDSNKETRVALVVRLGITPSTLNTIVKSRKDTEKCYTQCGRFSGQRKSLKQSQFEELESLLAVWFKQARGSNAVISGTLLKEKLYTLPQSWALKISKPLMAGSAVSSSNTVLCTKLYRESAKV